MIDSHAHLTSSELFSDIKSVMQRAKLAGVETIVNICTDRFSLEEGLKLQKENSGSIYNTAATHPHDVGSEKEPFFPIVEASTDKLVAIGETGLDYYYENAPKKLQQNSLSRYFELAVRSKLPVIFHCRDAFADLFAMANKEYNKELAVLHCFTGTMEEAKEVLNRGWMISFSGIITFKNAGDLRDVVKFAPLDRIFIETDAPFLAPQSRRGKPNEPAFIKETAERIAQIKEISFQEVIEATTENITQFFGLNRS